MEHHLETYWKFIEKYNLGININPDDPDFETALKRLENLDNLDVIYENIKKHRNKNQFFISDQMISLLGTSALELKKILNTLFGQNLNIQNSIFGSI